MTMEQVEKVLRALEWSGRKMCHDPWGYPTTGDRICLVCGATFATGSYESNLGTRERKPRHAPGCIYAEVFYK